MSSIYEKYMLGRELNCIIEDIKIECIFIRLNINCFQKHDCFCEFMGINIELVNFFK